MLENEKETVWTLSTFSQVPRRCGNRKFSETKLISEPEHDPEKKEEYRSGRWVEEEMANSVEEVEEEERGKEGAIRIDIERLRYGIRND